MVARHAHTLSLGRSRPVTRAGAAVGSGLALAAVCAAPHVRAQSRGGSLAAPTAGLASLPAAIQRAQAARQEDMNRNGEVGAGSETTGCMSVISQRRTEAVARLVALATRASAAGFGDWCGAHREALAVTQQLGYAGAQTCALDSVRPQRAYLSQGDVPAVPVPADVSAWVAALATRCGAGAARPLDDRCVVTVPGEFHLRPVETATSTGRELNSGLPVRLVGRGTLTRNGQVSVRVRVVGVEWEGWMFLPPASVPAGCL